MRWNHFILWVAFSLVLGVNIHLLCIDVGAALSKICTQLPNKFLLLFVLRNTSPASIVHQTISNQILLAYLKNRYKTMASLVSKKSAKGNLYWNQLFPPMH